MKKAVALIFAGLLLLPVLPAFSLVSGGSTEYASISNIALKIGEKVVLGPFEIQFVDVDKYWSSAKITVSTKSGSQTFILSTGQSAYYPSKNKEYLKINLLWMKSDTKSVLLELESPLIKVADENRMDEGDRIWLPAGYPRVSIKLIDAYDDRAVFSVTYPSGSSTRVTVYEGNARGVDYKLGGIYSYEDYIYIKLLKTTKGGPVEVEVYAPRVASIDFKIIRKEGEETQPGEVKTTLLYKDVLYKNEKLPIKVNKTKYYLSLVSVSSVKATFKLYKGTSLVGTYLVEVGESSELSGTPFKLFLNRVESKYERALVTLYGPEDAQVTPILREANVVASIDTVPKKVMLNDDLIIVISVKNNGKGDAYDVSVAAPIPNDFELVSMTKTWTLKTFPAFTSMPALIYVLKPTKVGEFEIGKAIVTFYDDQSLETGKKRTIYSQSLSGIKVYNVPAIDVTAQAYNGTWSSYVNAKVGDTLKARFTLSAAKGNPDYEFVTNATLLLDLPASLDGQSSIKIGTIKAGETKTVQVDLKVLKENLTNVRATLVYLDPLGNEHRLKLGNLVTINSIPPKVVVEEVKVWPSPEELPSYVNQTLAKMSDPTPLAKELKGVAEIYSPAGNPWKPLAIIFILAAIVLGGVAYKYWDESEKLRKRLERKKSRRPGGLPKKVEEEDKESTEIGEL
ncbi:hypothetical protein [Thermococcus sp. 21S7]|uniref:hypothetical protein n=1 Tax=Thermococcus sp. 21S7 TaxID=1638221 RepID=UPI00143AEE66|nr:hypothetical protein [Thermococcus sp. 21S7]NJE62310.1 hypothetical protein [Thermococcus sp. 21S7]